MATGSKIPFINENKKMKDALKIITNKKLGVLIAHNKKNFTTGIISDGDIRKLRQKNKDFQNLKIKNIMTKKPISINSEELAEKALRIMTEKRITSLCVFKKNKKDRTVGLLHIHHILDANIK